MLNKELHCTGDGFVSCEGYEVVMDMVKVKWKCGTRRNMEASFHMEMAVIHFFSVELLFSSGHQFIEYIISDFKPHDHIHGLWGH